MNPNLRQSPTMTKIVAVSIYAILVTCPAVAQTTNGSVSPKRQDATTSSTSLLVDTDDSCRLAVDDKDEVVIMPDHATRVRVMVGSHIVKCVVENMPDLSWRKVLETKRGEQTVVLVVLRALHSQLDQAVARNNASQLEQARVAALRKEQKDQENADHEARQHQAAEIQAKIADLKDDAEVNERAAESFDQEAQVLQGSAGEMSRIIANQKRREAERINQQLIDLQYQLQALQSQQ